LKSKIKTEVHTHTSVSPHAYSTVHEMVQQAQNLGISLLAITNHGPATPDGAHPWHFANLCCVPRKIGDVYVLRGAEANLINYNGTVDIPEHVLRRLDWVIASIHAPSLVAGTEDDHTNTYIKALENPLIDMIAHSGSPSYSYDIDAVLETAKRYDKVIEINNNTFRIRKKNVENCFRIAKRCAELKVRIAITTDAHSLYELGNTENAWELAMQAGVSEDQIVNLNAERFLTYLCERKGFDRAKFEDTKPGL